MLAGTGEHEAAPEKSDSRPISRFEEQGVKRVLFVDDDQICRLHFSEIASRYGVAVDLAASCDEAIGFARKHQYDLVVCDLMLPRLDGPAVMDRVRPTQERARYVVTTGLEPLHAHETLLATIHDGVLWKPWQSSQVQALLDELFTQSSPPPAELGHPMQLTGTLLCIESEAPETRLSARVSTLFTPSTRIVTCRSVEAAISILANERPQLVMLDLSTPDVRGVETVAKLSEAALGVPVVVISDSCDELLAIQAVQAGAQDYLIRDQMDERTLLRSIQNALDRARSQRRLTRVALYDQLTGAASRMQFEFRAEQALAAAKRLRTQLSLLFVDLDHFKQINDRFGHDVGDALLSAFALRLQDCLSEGELLCRLGGDEFVVLADHTTEVRAQALAATIREALVPSFELGGQSHTLSASVGIAVFPDDGTTLKQLLRHADLNMYREKGRRRRRSDPPPGAPPTRERHELEESMRPALERREFVPHYQPIVDLGTRQVLGLEVFMRWRHAREGLLHPDAFLQSLRDTGVIVPTGRFLLSEGCLLLSRLRAETGLDLILFVNVSESELAERQFERSVLDLLAENSLKPQHLLLDVTEEVTGSESEAVQDSLRAVRGRGVRVCLDDFGTGPASITRLIRVPIDAIKIGRAVVARLGDGGASEALVEAAVALGRSLHLQVMVAGVETEEQDRALRRLGCSGGQGLLYSPPMPADALVRFFQNERHQS